MSMLKKIRQVFSLNRNQYILLAILSFLLTFASAAVFVDIPKEAFYAFKKTVDLSEGQIDLNVDLEPGNYFLQIKHLFSDNRKMKVNFNNKEILPFRTIKNAKRGASNHTIRSYFFIKSENIHNKNLLNINFEKTIPQTVKIYLSSFRKTFYGNKISVFSKPVHFYSFKPITWLSVFCLVFSYLVITFSILEEYAKKATGYADLLLKIITVTGCVIAVNNLTPFLPYTLFISPPLSCLWFLTAILCSSIVFLRKYHNTIKPREIDVVDQSQRLSVGMVFIGLAAILAIERIWAVLQNRMPMGHDTFQYLTLQYNIFFNEPALKGELPRWFPFMTQGTLSNIWVIISQGLFVSVLSPFAKFFKHLNFFYIYHTGVLFDELILLFGSVLLARRYFRSAATILFVASSITFTAISSVQIWFDFHIVYLLPLTLYCFDCGIEKISAKYLFFGGLLFVGMFLGNLPYYPPLFAFIVILFCLLRVFCSGQTFKNLYKGFRTPHLMAILIPGILSVLIFVFLKTGTEEIISYNSGRDSNFAVNNIEQFLNYGGYVNLHKYWELISRSSNNMDNTCFGGLLLVPFVLLTLFGVRKKTSYVFGLMALLMILFSAGIIVPHIFYYVVPLAKFYRHIGLVAPVAKLFLIFYAGFGFELFWQTLRHNKYADNTGYEITNLLVPGVTLVYIFVLAFLSRFAFPIFTYSSWSSPTENQLFMADEQIISGLYQILILSGLFITILIIALLGKPRYTLLTGMLFLSVHLLDVSSVKFVREYGRTPAVSGEVINLFRTYDYKYNSIRNQKYFSNSRFSVLAPYLFSDGKTLFDTTKPRHTIGRFGAIYWDMESFCFFDAVSSIFHARHFLKPVGDYYNVWAANAQTMGNPDFGFPFPNSTAFRKLCGYDYPKIQLFSKIHVLANDTEVKEVMQRPDFKGDMLLACSQGTELRNSVEAVSLDSVKTVDSQINERITVADVSIKNFSLNKLEVSVNNTTGKEAVLYYADAWHPKWKASVNGKSAKIFKANIGYKAVVIPLGKSEVRFEFGSTFNKYLFSGIIFLGNCVCFVVIFLFYFEFRKRRP